MSLTPLSERLGKIKEIFHWHGFWKRPSPVVELGARVNETVIKYLCALMLENLNIFNLSPNIGRPWSWRCDWYMRKSLLVLHTWRSLFLHVCRYRCTWYPFFEAARILTGDRLAANATSASTPFRSRSSNSVHNQSGINCSIHCAAVDLSNVPASIEMRSRCFQPDGVFYFDMRYCCSGCTRFTVWYGIRLSFTRRS